MINSQLSGNKWETAFFLGTVYGQEEAQAVIRGIDEWAPSSSRRVREFEKNFAGYVGAQYGVAANSWVGAAHLLAIHLDFKPGDQVIVPALTFQASANIFAREGATIVFADSDPLTFNIDPMKLEEKITTRTRALVAVHMGGQPCNMEPILTICRKHELVLIQDAAHAPGAEYHGKKLGELGDFVIYSFHQTKNISTLGEGGMIVTNDRETAVKMKRLRAHGSGLYIGISSRMTDIQAAVGLIQLKRLEKLNSTRRKLAYYLSHLLSEIDGITPPCEIPGVLPTYHLYNALVNENKIKISRNRLLKQLWTKKRIMTATQYYPPLHRIPVFKALGHKEGECPAAEDLSARLITLPLSPRFNESDMEELAAGIKDVINNAV